MSIPQKKCKGNTLPPVALGYDAKGRPIFVGTLGEMISRNDRRITFICPSCGRRNRHGWAVDSPAEVPQHKGSHCECWPDGYLIVPAASNKEVVQ